MWQKKVEMQLQAKECQGLVATTRGYIEQSREVLEGALPANSLDFCFF